MVDLPPDAHLTTWLTWKATAATAGFDVLLLWLVSRLVTARRFGRLKRPLAWVAGAFWFAMWTFAMWGPWWGLVYHRVFPEWMRWVGPPGYALLFAAVAVGLWWLARQASGRPALAFVALGGLASLPGHLFAFHARDMLEKTPILQGVSETALLVFGIFEFMIYWTFILLVATALAGGARGASSSMGE